MKNILTIITIDNMLRFIPIITGIFLLISIIIAYKAIRLQKELKQIDVLLYFQNRFNLLVYGDHTNIKTKEDVKLYWEKFWLLQKDQYRLWKKGFIDDIDFERWLTTKKRCFINGCNNYENFPDEITIPFKEGWKSSKDAMSDNTFVEFIESISFHDTKKCMKALKSIFYKRKINNLYKTASKNH